MVEKPLSPNSLVRIASYLDPPRADLAQMALAREAIPSALGNANFLSWYWYYSNAVGGVVLYVRRCEADPAREVLAAARSKSAARLPPWICPSCGQRVAGGWDACWQCGEWPDGTPSGEVLGGSAAPPAIRAEGVSWWNVSRFVAVVAAVALIILFITRGPIPPLILAPCVFFFVFLLWRFEASSDWQSGRDDMAGPGDRSSCNPRATRSQVSKAIVTRAWQAAVLGLFCFQPLGFYSMRLLWKLSGRDTQLGRADTWRCCAAFFFNLLSILVCCWFVLALLSGLFGW